MSGGHVRIDVVICAHVTDTDTDLPSIPQAAQQMTKAYCFVAHLKCSLTNVTDKGHGEFNSRHTLPFRLLSLGRFISRPLVHIITRGRSKGLVSHFFLSFIHFSFIFLQINSFLGAN